MASSPAGCWVRGRSVRDVEQALVRDAAAEIVGVAPLAVVDAELGGGPGVLDQPLQQIDLRVLFLDETVAEQCASASARSERIVSTNSECAPLNE